MYQVVARSGSWSFKQLNIFDIDEGVKKFSVLYQAH